LLALEKIFISGIVESSKWGGIHLTLARTDLKAGHKGFTLFGVPLKDTKGIKTSLFEDMGRMGISTGGFVMEDVELPDHHVIGEPNRGFYNAMEGFSAARVLIGATCVGASEGALELGIEHIKTRKAFGRPLGSFEPLGLWIKCTKKKKLPIMTLLLQQLFPSFARQFMLSV